jgi:hypothetical protein
MDMRKVICILSLVRVFILILNFSLEMTFRTAVFTKKLSSPSLTIFIKLRYIRLQSDSILTPRGNSHYVSNFQNIWVKQLVVYCYAHQLDKKEGRKKKNEEEGKKVEDEK